jgi:hypothetical protein
MAALCASGESNRIMPSRGDRFGDDHRYAFADETRFFDR